jgi:putative hydrolase
MIDLHTHSLLSDGELIPAELARRFDVAGYEALAITDHGDSSNLEMIIPQLVLFCDEINRQGRIKVIPGIELTHVPPTTIPELIRRSRTLGAKLIVVHGETIVEPVAPGTNKIAIESSADILAHPGLISEEEVLLAKERSVCLELSSRKGHSLTNGHVAMLAKRLGASLVLNSDAHAPGDIWPAARLHEIALGASLTEKDFKKMMEDAQKIVERCLTSKR